MNTFKNLKFSSIAALLIMACGAFVLFSWQTGFSVFEKSHFMFTAMNPLTAIGFLFCGTSLFVSTFDDQKTQAFAKPLAILVIGFSVVKMISFFGLDLQLDRILFREKLDALSVPNRMAPNTALLFLLTGFALFFQNKETKRQHLVRDYVLTPALFVAMTAIIGHIYASNALTQVGVYIPMAFNTAVCFLVLSLGIMLLDPDKGLISTFNKKYAGAKVGRRLLPYVTLTPLLLGWLRVHGEGLGIVDAATGASLMAMVAVTIGLIILSGSAHVVNRLEETLELKKLAEADRRLNRLKRFFPRAIAEKILSGEIEDPFKWHRNDVTVMFIDLRGFTTFAELGEPEEVMKTLQDYYQTIAQTAQKHGGSIGHLAGDGVMIFFNDPMPIENPQKNAVMMSLEIRDALNKLCEHWSKRDLNLHFGAGIASGYTTIGGIGSEGFWDYTVIGTAPNIASRLCSAANGGQILISRRFLNSVADSVEVENIGNLDLKGIQKPVTTYNITRAKEAST